MRGRLLPILVVPMVLAACGGGDKKAGSDPGTQPPADVPADLAPAEVAPETVETPDLGPADLGPEDPGQPDPGQPDLGPPDPGQPDLGPSDPGQPDPGQPDLGPPADPGENLSEVVAACDYVLESICDKVLTKCDFLGLLPKNWMDTCTNWLVGNHATIVGACNQLDNAQTTDPTVQLIKSMGPIALQQCVDNFQCTADNIMKVVGAVTPIIKGQKIDTAGVLTLVADLCFK